MGESSEETKEPWYELPLIMAGCMAFVADWPTFFQILGL